MWESIFSHDLSVAEKLLRSLISYAFLMIGLRLAGKRELAQLDLIDTNRLRFSAVCCAGPNWGQLP